MADNFSRPSNPFDVNALDAMRRVPSRAAPNFGPGSAAPQLPGGSFEQNAVDAMRRVPALAGPNRGPGGAGVTLPGGVSLDSVYGAPDVAGPMAGANGRGGGNVRDIYGPNVGPNLTPGGRAGMAVRGAALPVLGEAISTYNNLRAAQSPQTLGDRFIQDAYQNPSLRGGAGLGQYIGEALNTVGGAYNTINEIGRAGDASFNRAGRALDRGRPVEALVNAGRGVYDIGKSALVDHGAKPLWDAFYGVGDQLYNAMYPQAAGPRMSEAPISMDKAGNFSRAPTNQAEYDQVMRMKYGPSRQEAGAEGSADSPFPAQTPVTRGMPTMRQAVAGGRPRESADAYAARAQAEIARRAPATLDQNRRMAESYALNHPNERGTKEILDGLGHTMAGEGSLVHGRAQARELPRQTDISLRNAMANERQAEAQLKTAERAPMDRRDPFKQQQARMASHINDLYTQDEQRLGVDAAQALYAKRMKAAFGTRETQTRDNTLEDRLDQIEVK